MGTSMTRKPYQLRNGRPSGPEWQKYCKLLWAQWAQQPGGLTCYYCGEPIAGPAYGEVAHLISPILRPDLAWDGRHNLRPSHGSGKRRSAAGLNCNWIAALAPDMRKDADSRDLPFTPELLARQAAESANFLAKRNRDRDRRGRFVPPQKADAIKSAIPASIPAAEIGREW